jgi:hypothetical protein
MPINAMFSFRFAPKTEFGNTIGAAAEAARKVRRLIFLIVILIENWISHHFHNFAHLKRIFLE